MKAKLTILIYLISVTITAGVNSQNELNCEADPKFRYFEITTNQYENSDQYNISVLKNCQIDNKWKVKQDNSRMCVIPERVYEGEDNIRRSFRFTYHDNPSY